MKESLDKTMLKAASVFKKHADKGGNGKHRTADWIYDNYYLLEICAEESAKEFRRTLRTKKGSEKLPGLFDLCRKICKNGVIPDEETLIVSLDEVGCFEISRLPAVLTGVAVEYALKGLENGDTQMVSNAVSSLRRIGGLDFEKIYMSVSKAEKLLLADPSGIYPELDEESKAEYRKAVLMQASKRGKSEEEYIAEILIKAKKESVHIGKFLFGEKNSFKMGAAVLVLENVVPLLAAVAVAVLLRSFMSGLLLVFPFVRVFRYLVERNISQISKPKRFLRLNPSSPKVLETHALITVSTLLPSADKIKKLEDHLEKLYLSNCGGNIKICCLADFKAARTPSKPEDKTAVRAAMQAFDRLNKKYSGGFILAVRPRVYSKTQREFTGKERKRGAITDLVNAIKGDCRDFSVVYGDKAELSKVKYLIALDADTCLDFDAAKELVSVAEHPLNRAVISAEKRRVISGYGIIMPGVENRINYDNCTFFEKIMAGSNGVSAYSSLYTEKYQALFGESVFNGKGIIDVEAYHELMRNMPEEQILSHDIIESGYLRTGFASDIKITEGFPKTPSVYFNRMHRWIRGDWQNIKFIFGKNPLSFVSRYKLLDNLFRSISAPAALAAIIISAFASGAYFNLIALACVLAVVLPDFVSAFENAFKIRTSSVTGLYFSELVPISLSAAVRAFLSVSFLATESCFSLDAALKALWRLFISKKNLLEWVPAANVERLNSFWVSLENCLPSVAVFIILFASGLPFARLIAIAILLSVPFLLVSAEKSIAPKFLSDAGREKLTEYVAAMWGFFNELCNEKSNFLVPDNVQFSPKKAVANQTSPTNIGLMLLSFLAARDFELISSRELYEKLDKSLKTVERLEKYKGNLYNWYGISDCRILNPKFISTVDSGNFLCCLTALKEGVKEYAAECAELSKIAERIGKLINATDLGCLYNKQKNLFHIGLYPENGQKSESFYDLLMSESRMTSYFAIAKRIVPKKHWSALGRILVSCGRYSGPVSWTGTAFEYFMPELFIPSPKGSIFYEALRFCLICQRKKAGKRPFGFSESGFYAFDGALNYQYKAHGVQKIGLRRGLDDEFVVSPYSSFLSLTTAPEVSIKNLLRLEKLRAYGRYGFFEAVDFTRGRAENNEETVVHSFMAHHVGMSFIAADNALNGRCIQRRFMRDRFMKGAECLLNEQISPTSRIFKDIKHTQTPKIREKTVKENVVCSNPSPANPRVFLYSNGRLSSCIADNGCGFLIYNGINATVRPLESLENPKGIFAVFKTEKEIIPLVSSISRENEVSFKAEFLPNRALYSAEKGGVRLKMESGVLKKESCEIRKFTVENASSESLKGELMIYFEPCLTTDADFSSHKAFSKLFIIDEKDEKNGCILFSRKNGGEKTAIAAGIAENCKVTAETSKEKVLQSPLGVFSLGMKSDYGSSRGNPDCCCAFKIDFEIPAKEKKDCRLIIAVADSKKRAADAFLTAKVSQKGEEFAKSVPTGGEAEKTVMKKLLPSIVFYKSLVNGKKEGDFSDFRKEDLWSFGISGDLPIILLEITSEENAEQLVPYIRTAKKLFSCGINADTVICYRNKEAYSNAVRNRITDILKKEDCELMAGVKGGFFVVNFSDFSSEREAILRSFASFTVVDGKMLENRKKAATEGQFIPKKQIAVKNANKEHVVKEYNFTERRILIKSEPSSVDIPWYMVYSNQTFGTMVSDKAIGFTWALNSRENKLTPWNNDLMADNRGEILFLHYKGCFYDLAALGEAVFTPEKASWKLTVEKISFEVSVTVPKKGTAKKISVEIHNKSQENVQFDLFYYTTPILGERVEKLSAFFAKAFDNGAVFTNRFSEITGYSVLQCDSGNDYICFSKPDFFSGRFNSRETVPDNPCCAVGKKLKLKNGETESINFFFSWAAKIQPAIKMPFVCDFSDKTEKSLKINTSNASVDLFFNSFLYHQIKNARFYGRTGPYQCSGAYGFRDQLQDSLAFLYTEPELCRRHILRCAAVQFKKGDVLHWWHVIPDKNVKIKGIRTRCSDDMLWLVYVCGEYIKKTADWGILDVEIPYIYCDEIPGGEKELYETVVRTGEKASLLEHCIKAVEYSMRFGENGFPLIGSCDWNDGFSNIGSDDKGESVWLAMFQIIVLDSMADICIKKELPSKVTLFRKLSQSLRKTVEEKAWNGESYARAILKNGEYLGFDDGYLDILPQAFSVFAGLKNSKKAVETAYNKLFDKESRVVRLLSPAFDADDYEKIGYICNYPSGIRENGGQYTHAAVWLAMALFKVGMNEEAVNLVNAINPLNRYSHQTDACGYRAEPYVLAGDVYYGENINGRAGWSHFTGAAAWFYRCVFENRDQIDNQSV